MRKNIFVTGASGFLGRNITKFLSEKNYAVTGVNSEQFNIVTQYGFVNYNFSDIDAIVHVAGKVFVPESWSKPDIYYQVNTIGTQHILDICRMHKIPLVYISGYVYGADVINPIKETYVPRPNNPYAHSKYLAEELCRFYSHNWGVDVIILRPFNIIGQGQNEHFLVPKIIYQALYSDKIEVQDLRPKRDFVYIDDVALAVQKAINYKAEFEIFNVGAGKSYTVKDVIDTAQAIVGTNKEIVSRNNRRMNEIDDVVADISRAKTKLHWQPKYSLYDALKCLIDKERKV